MRIFWLPYLRLQYPNFASVPAYRIGRAVFIDDSERNWNEVLKRPRPKHLLIYRDYPRINCETGDALFGTLVRSDDERWLNEHIDETLAVLYFLCDWQGGTGPAERFAFMGFNLGDPEKTDTGLIGYWTKHGQLIECPESLKLYPPLAVRLKHRTLWPETEFPEHQELLRRINQDAHDRLVVAVRQYFRTQFTDTFTSPEAQDFTLHCGAIEAALGIDAQGGVSDEFVDRLVNLFGDTQRREHFFRGLYAARSVFVHGLPRTEKTVRPKDLEAYRVFSRVQGRLSALRAVTREVILAALGGRRPTERYPLDDSATVILDKVLESDAIWNEAKSLLLRSKAAEILISMDQAQFNEVRELARMFYKCFEWDCVDRANPKHVLAAIRTCALVIAKLTGARGTVYEESDRIGRAADCENIVLIEEWIMGVPWSEGRVIGGRLDTIQRLMKAMAKFFDRLGLVPLNRM